MEVVDRTPGGGGRHQPHQVALYRLGGPALALSHGVLAQTPLAPPSLVNKGLGNSGNGGEDVDLEAIIYIEYKRIKDMIHAIQP